MIRTAGRRRCRISKPRNHPDMRQTLHPITLTLLFVFSAFLLAAQPKLVHYETYSARDFGRDLKVAPIYNPKDTTDITIPWGCDTINEQGLYYCDDLPPYPEREWRDVDPATFSDAQARAWNYFREMYPIGNNNPLQVPVYSFPEPEGWSYNRFEKHNLLTRFFNDTLMNWIRYPQRSPGMQGFDQSFVERVIGPPTTVTFTDNHKGGRVDYLYAFKIRDRYQPCPFVFYPTTRTSVGEFYEPCATLKFTFDARSGQLLIVLFYA